VLLDVDGLAGNSFMTRNVLGHLMISDVAESKAYSNDELDAAIAESR
jgi:hypothetical protein